MVTRTVPLSSSSVLLANIFPALVTLTVTVVVTSDSSMYSKNSITLPDTVKTIRPWGERLEP
jgi:hypothetical protein